MQISLRSNSRPPLSPKTRPHRGLRRHLLRLEGLEERTLLSFLAPVNYDTGINPNDVVVGDFAHNGHLDIATANAGSNTVSILLDNGDGTFQAPQNYAVGVKPDSLAIGDFNGDGIPDLAVANYGTAPNYADSSVSVLLGNGDGSFQAAQSFAAGSAPISLDVADFTSDGKADLVVANATSSPSVSVLLGNGDGTFQAPIQTAVAGSISAVAVADFNGDHQPDLVVAGTFNSASSITLLLGNGDGTFQTGNTYPTDDLYQQRSIVPNGRLLTTGDLNGDGKAGVAVCTVFNGIDVFLGNGNGTLKSRAEYADGFGSQAIAVADINGDGKVDLVTAGDLARGASVLLGNGDGTFQAPRTTDTATYAVAVAVGDVNGDGHLDLVTANNNGNDVSVRLGNGDGTFVSTPTPLAVGGSVVVGDLRNDGKLDVVGVGSAQVVNIQMGNGDGTFQSARQIQVPGPGGTSAVALADLTGDGNLDLIVAIGAFYNGRYGSTVDVLLGNGDGTFKPAITFAVGGGPMAIAVGDLTGDGIPALVVGDSGGTGGPAGLSVLLGNGDGTFQAPQTYLPGSSITSVALADLNNDGQLDAVVNNVNNAPSTIGLLLGNGDGTFQAPLSYGVVAGAKPTAMVVGDANGDGNLDVGVLSVLSGGMIGQQPSTVSLLLGNGDGTLQPPRSVAVGSGAAALALGDYNNDGNLDLAVGGPFGVRLLFGNGRGGGHTSMTTIGAGSALTLAAGDFNGDGYLDLVTGQELLLNGADWTTPATASGRGGEVGSLALATAPALGHSASPAAVLGPTTLAAGGDGPTVDPEAASDTGYFEGYPASERVRGLPEASPGVLEAPAVSWPQPLATDLLGPEATVPAQPLA
jgi:hypothetical protein